VARRRITRHSRPSAVNLQKAELVEIVKIKISQDPEYDGYKFIRGADHPSPRQVHTVGNVIERVLLHSSHGWCRALSAVSPRVIEVSLILDRSLAGEVCGMKLYTANEETWRGREDVRSSEWSEQSTCKE